LKELLGYDPEAGVFVWLVSRGSALKGRRAGCVDDTNGYTLIRIDGEQYRAHRLAILWMTGEWPEDQTDHINGDRADNRWGNLREATNAQNQRNTNKLRSDNTSGLKGVCWDKAAGKWKAAININGQTIYLGLFLSTQDAARAYDEAAPQYHGEFARTNKSMGLI
jgi:hypothetical protein